MSHCLNCGCTEDHACTDERGTPCHWIFEARELGVGVCSNCATPRLEATVRPEVATFARIMEARLAANDHKGGWQGMTSRALFNRIVEEADELLTELALPEVLCNPLAIAIEAADVANFALMIADNELRRAAVSAQSTQGEPPHGESTTHHVRTPG